MTSGQRQSINVISAVTAQPDFWGATYTGNLNAEAFVAFLQDFMKCSTRSILLFIDGHPAHKANAVKRYIQSLAGRLGLHCLQPHAPDLNPDEFVWSHMKANGVSKRPLMGIECMRKRVEEDLATIKGNPELARSFFGAKTVAHAKD